MGFLTTNQQALWVMQHMIVVLESWAFSVVCGQNTELVEDERKAFTPVPPVIKGSDWSTCPAWCLCDEVFGVTGWCVFSEPCVHDLRLLHLCRCPFLHLGVLQFFSFNCQKGEGKNFTIVAFDCRSF